MARKFDLPIALGLVAGLAPRSRPRYRSVVVDPFEQAPRYRGLMNRSDIIVTKREPKPRGLAALLRKARKTKRKRALRRRARRGWL